MSTTTTTAASDGTLILVRSWQPVGDARAGVVLVHGLGEHSGRYEHVGGHLARAGYAVAAPDLRGFGASGGTRACVDRVETYLADLDPLVEQAAAGGRPVALLGHSMGGLIALRYAQTRGRPDLLILSSPSLDAAVPAVKRIASRLLRRVAPRLAIANDITGDQLSRDPAVGEAYFADPLVHPRTTVALAGALLEAMGPARAEGIPMPALVIHGEDDTLVPPRFSEPLGALPGVTRITFPGFHHESFNEEGGAAALEAVTGWLGART